MYTCEGTIPWIYDYIYIGGKYQWLQEKCPRLEVDGGKKMLDGQNPNS